MPKHSKTLILTNGLIPRLTKPPISYATIVNKARIKEASLQYRHDVIQATKRQNYFHEYDRLKGMLANNISHGHHDHDRLQHRQQELTKLFALSFATNNPLHELYKSI